jgi:hypothetical protein
MNTLIQTHEPSSMSTRKKIVVAIVILTVFCLAVWVGLDMALRVTSGHS